MYWKRRREFVAGESSCFKWSARRVVVGLRAGWLASGNAAAWLAREGDFGRERGESIGLRTTRGPANGAGS